MTQPTSWRGRGSPASAAGSIGMNPPSEVEKRSSPELSLGIPSLDAPRALKPTLCLLRWRYEFDSATAR
jgi:hypothetical protein